MQTKTKQPQPYVAPPPKNAAEASARRTAAIIWQDYWKKFDKAREPQTFREAAKLLGTSIEVVKQMVTSLDLLTIEVRGRTLIPMCELRRFRSKPTQTLARKGEKAKVAA